MHSTVRPFHYPYQLVAARPSFKRSTSLAWQDRHCLLHKAEDQAMQGAQLNRVIKGIFGAAALSLLGACSTEAWYEGMKARARNECYQRSPGEQQNCLEKVNKQTYDQYEKERAQDRTSPKP
jgi:hypothetical protein